MGNEVRSSTSTPPAPPASGGPQASDSGATSGTPAIGKGCSSVRNPALARTQAGNRARTDALRKVCAGGDPQRPVTGTVTGGVSRYFQEAGQVCAEGEFQVTCEPPATESTE